MSNYNPVMGFQGFGAPPAKASRKVQGINKTERMTFAPGRVQQGQFGGPAPTRSYGGGAPKQSSYGAKQSSYGGGAPKPSSYGGGSSSPSSAPKTFQSSARNPSMADPNAKKLDKAAIYGFQGVGVAPAKNTRMVQGINKTERMTFAPGRIK